MARAARVVSIPYTRVVRGNRFFEPNAAMRRKGFRPLPLGPDDEASRRRAWSLFEKWTAIRTGAAEETVGGATKPTREEVSGARVYPRGSIGEAWQQWVRSDEWAKMAPSTRNKIWWEAWNKRIEPFFADELPDNVTMADLSLWRAGIETKSGVDAAHKAMKVWRALWRIMKALRYTQLSDPSEKVVNRAPQSRTQRFSHAEAVRLAKRAWRMGFRGLACIIMIAWDTGFSPVDCRTLCAKHQALDLLNNRLVMDRSQEGRTKTGVAVIGTLSRFGDFLVRQYLLGLGAEMTPEAILFRMRTGVPYGESRLGADFARIREAEFPGDKRQLRDMRRSGVMEAFAGGAMAQDISEKYGNSLDRSTFLFRTYNPVDLAKVRNADARRLAGRRLQSVVKPKPASDVIPTGKS